MRRETDMDIDLMNCELSELTQSSQGNGVKQRVGGALYVVEDL